MRKQKRYGQALKQAIAGQVVSLVESFIPLPISPTQIAGLINQFIKPKFDFGVKLVIYPFLISKENLVFTRPVDVSAFGDGVVFNGEPQANLCFLTWVTVATSLWNLNRLPSSAKAKVVSDINRGLPHRFERTLTCGSAEGCADRVQDLSEILNAELTRKLLTPVERVTGRLETLPDYVAQSITQLNSATLKPALSRSTQLITLASRVNIPLSLLAMEPPALALDSLANLVSGVHSESNLLPWGLGLLALTLLALKE